MQTQNYTVLDVMARMMNNGSVVSKCYFDYIKSLQSEQELDLLNIDGRDLNEGSSHTVYNFETENVGDTSNCEREVDTVNTDTSDDECIVVGVGTLECSPDETEIVHEILDDDDDIASIIYFTSKNSEINVRSSKKSQANVSFLNSNNVDSNIKINSKKNLPTPDSISSSTKLDDLHIDTVESREIISEKFTADTNSASCIIIDLQNDDWDGTKLSSDTEKPSQRLEGLVTPKTSHDDQHSYERDFQSTDLPEVNEEPTKETDEICIENNERVQESASFDCLASQSKISNSSDRCNTPTSLSEVVSDETYLLPTSPDISSTCEPNDLICKEEQEITINELPLCQMPSIDEIVSIEKDMIKEITDMEKELPNKITNADKTTINEENITNEIAQHTQVPKKNGKLLEHNNNNDEEDRIVSPPIEQEKSITLLNDKSPRKEIDIFTSKQKLENPEEVHQKYDELKGKHGLDDCLTGPIEKIEFPTNLNLFDDSFPEKEIVNATSSSSSLLSPGFDSTDDFKSYVAYYQENGNKVNMTPKITYAKEKANTPSISEESKIGLKNSNKSVSIPTEEHQRKIIEKEEKIGQVTPHEPSSKKPCFQLDTILKKSILQQSRWKIQPEQINPASLEQYSVKLNDPCLQGEPCVVIERMSEMEILKWYKFSENARRMRLQAKNNPMTMLRVDYDKSTTLLTENDKAMYREKEAKNFQQNDHLKVVESMLDNDSEEYFYIPTIFHVPTKSFYPKFVGNEKSVFNDKCCVEKPFLDLKVANKIVENFNNCDEPINLCDLVSQPALNPEFEKTLNMEEVPPTSNIPSDLYNLNLKKFYPSPVTDYFSPHSSVHNYFPEYSTSTDKYSKPQEESQSSTAVSYNRVVSLETIDPEIRVQVPPESQNNSKQKEDPQPQRTKKYLLKHERLEDEPEARLPLKKRKYSVINTEEVDSDEEIMKRARADEAVEFEDISYPATPAISIAEIQENLERRPKTFKTPAQRKEMPQPLTLDRSPTLQFCHTLQATPKIVTEQHNNHSYNNPTINYHMNKVPYPFFPCTSLAYFPSIILPMNSSTTFDVNMMNNQPKTSGSHPTPPP